MLKNLGFLAVGLSLGVAFIVLTRARTPDVVRDRVNAVGTPVEHDQLVTDLRDEVKELSVRIATLEARVSESAKGSDAPVSRTSPTRMVVQAARGAPAVVASQMPAPEKLVEQLVAAGFSPHRAKWISERSDAFVMEQLQARYESERTGKPLQVGQDPQATLRRELGDAEYERYLRAIGREASVNVGGVIENSPAARAGLLQGDRILSYDGQRVFDMREVVPLTIRGAPGESVVLEVLRDGQPLRLIVPRGPLGVTLTSDLGIPR